MRKTILTLVAVMAVLFASCGGSNEDSTGRPPLKSLQFSEKNVSLHVDETKFLVAKLYPADAWPTWNLECSDNSVVGVNIIPTDSIVIYGNKPGTATIKLLDYEYGLSDTCFVTVTDGPVAVQKITFSESELEMYEGNQSYVNVTVFPTFATESLILKSENEDIATFSTNYNERGITVYAVKPGSTYIVATSKDGNVVAKCKVTVKGIEQIILDKSELELYENQDEKLTVTVAPEYATKRNIVWTSENEDIAKASYVDFYPDYVSVSGGRPGTTNIIGTSYDGKVVVKCKVTVKSNNQIDYHPYDDDTQW